ncbi:hypothetical protein HMSSN139_54500 [Paenibacillus sp. HMSSN-139]|nr:hypothetical protein HMSSN139_54500 [Paenibacillus sp. HMSSN-139]
MDSLTSGTRQVIKVLLADDHQLFREGLKRILNMEEDIEVVGECGDGTQVLESCLQLHPEIVLMDINMPLLNGVDATAELREALPDVKVIILSIHDDESYVLRRCAKARRVTCSRTWKRSP